MRFFKPLQKIPCRNRDHAINLNGFGKEAGRIAEIETDILSETGAVINALPLQAGSYRDRTGLMQELRRDGLDL